MEQVNSCSRADHLEVDTDGLDGWVRVGEECRNWMRSCVCAWLSEAVDVDIDPPSELGDEVFDVHSGATVDVRRPLSSQHCDAHAPSLDGMAASRGIVLPIQLG